MNVRKYYNNKDDIWAKALSIMSRILYNIQDKMVDWARSPEQGCVNSIYRDALQVNRDKKYTGRD